MRFLSKSCTKFVLLDILYAAMHVPWCMSYDMLQKCAVCVYSFEGGGREKEIENSNCFSFLLRTLFIIGVKKFSLFSYVNFISCHFADCISIFSECSCVSYG